MILFHGSDKIVEKPVANYGRNKVDFGQGFYLTSIHEQAVKWAKIIAFKNGLGWVANDNVIDTVVRWEEV